MGRRRGVEGPPALEESSPRKTRYFSSSGASPPAPNPSISRVLEWFSLQKTRYFSSSGAPRARPNPSISRVLEWFSREKTRYFSSSGAPRASPKPFISRVLEGSSRQKNTLFIIFWRPPGPPGEGGLETAHTSAPVKYSYNKYSSILIRRKPHHNTASGNTPSHNLASPRQGAADFPCLRQLPPTPLKQ